MQVERVDFVGFLTQDVARAKRFYTDVLGLEVESEGEHDIEFTLGQVTLDVFDPSSIGQPSWSGKTSARVTLPSAYSGHSEFDFGSRSRPRVPP